MENNYNSSRPNISVSENFELGFYSPYIQIIDKYLNPLKPKSDTWSIIIAIVSLLLLVSCAVFQSTTKSFKIITINKNQENNKTIEVSSKDVISKYNSTASTFVYATTCFGIFLYSFLYFLILGYFYSKFCIRFASLNFFQPFSILLSIIFCLFLFIINIIFFIYLSLNFSFSENNIRQFNQPKVKDIALYMNVFVSFVFLVCLGFRYFNFQGFNFGK